MATRITPLLWKLVDSPDRDFVNTAPLKSLRWGDIDLTDAEPTLEVRDSEVLVSCRSGRLVSQFLRSMRPRQDLPQSTPPLSGVLAGTSGTVNLTCDRAHLSAVRQPLEGLPVVSLWGIGAELRTGSEQARCWSTRLEVDGRSFPKNFALRTTRNGICRSDGNHVRLVGANHTLYLLASKGREDVERSLVIESNAGTGELDLKTLETEFMVLEFVLGQTLYFPSLIAFNSAGSPIAWKGLGWGRRRRTTNPRVPPAPVDEGRYVAKLFRKAAVARATKPDLRLEIPLCYYVESLEDHLDGAYLKLQVALEALADRLIKQTPMPPLLVKNARAWEEYAELIRPTAVKHARSRSDARILMNKLRSAMQRPSTKKVEEAFRQRRVALLPEEMKALAARNRVAHAALMSDPESRNVARDRDRVSLVRTLLVRLISLAIGYRDVIADPTGKARSVR